jgi:hypothetical protein
MIKPIVVVISHCVPIKPHRSAKRWLWSSTKKVQKRWPQLKGKECFFCWYTGS